MPQALTCYSDECLCGKVQLHGSHKLSRRTRPLYSVIKRSGLREPSATARFRETSRKQSPRLTKALTSSGSRFRHLLELDPLQALTCLASCRITQPSMQEQTQMAGTTRQRPQWTQLKRDRSNCFARSPGQMLTQRCMSWRLTTGTWTGL